MTTFIVLPRVVKCQPSLCFSPTLMYLWTKSMSLRPVYMTVGC